MQERGFSAEREILRRTPQACAHAKFARYARHDPGESACTQSGEVHHFVKSNLDAANTMGGETSRQFKGDRRQKHTPDPVIGDELKHEAPASHQDVAVFALG